MTTPMTSQRKCPSCSRPMEPAYRPFCSRRCADLDLQRWLRGAYAIPAVDDEREEAAGYPPDEA